MSKFHGPQVDGERVPKQRPSIDERRAAAAFLEAALERMGRREEIEMIEVRRMYGAQSKGLLPSWMGRHLDVAGIECFCVNRGKAVLEREQVERALARLRPVDRRYRVSWS